MAIEQLTEQSTKDEVNDYVEQVVEEVKAERAGTEKTEEVPAKVEKQPKGDAQIASEHAGKEKTPVVQKSDEKPAKATKAKAEKAAKAEEAGDKESSWLDDDLKTEVAAYGLDESELSDFTSREELERALRLFDKRALEAGRKALEEGEQPTGRNEKGQFVKKEAPVEKETPEAEPAKDGRLITLDKDVYDEELVGQFNRLHDFYEERFKALEARFHEADALAEEQRFDSAIDKLEMPNLFGTTGKETADELKRREDVLAQAKVIQAGLRVFGRDVELESLVSRAAPMVFSSEFDKHKLKQQTRKVSKQANSRLGGGATRPQDPPEDPRDEFDRLYKELERAT